MKYDDQVRAGGRAVGEALSGVVGVVGDVHAAVTRRVSWVLPRPLRTVADTQGALAGAIYDVVAVAHRWMPVAVAGVAGVVVPSGGDALSRSPTGQAVLCALNGLWGDHFAVRHRPLAVRAAVRVGLADGVCDEVAVTGAFPDATSRLAIFLHGLAEADSAWLWGDDPAYGDLLRDQGITPVYVRYNSGLSLVDNGVAVSELVHRLVDSWPVLVEDIHVVGHSMGGLVACNACWQGVLDDRVWPRLVRTVVTLGTPHLGAPLAKGVRLAEGLLSRLPETQPLARVLATRSVGIDDLRSGLRVPALPHATYRFVAATVTRDLGHPAGQLIGDGLVRPASAFAEGATCRATVGADAEVHVGAVHHFSLLNHPRVGALLRSLITPGP